jgi:hypothetical protein
VVVPRLGQCRSKGFLKELAIGRGGRRWWAESLRNVGGHGGHQWGAAS